MRRSPGDEPTFADVVRSLPADPHAGPGTPLVELARLTEFTDADGIRWRRRGDSFEGKALQRLLLNPGLRVLHEYMGETREVSPSEREQFWAAARRVMDACPQSKFYGADFKNEEREHLLVVHEDC